MINRAADLPDANLRPESTVRFNAILYPHRSLSLGGFSLLMTCLITLGTAVGGFFASRGAWPILAFYGVELLVIYWMFRENYRSGRAYETVRLTSDALMVERYGPGGWAESVVLQPHWLQVEIDDSRRNEGRLTLKTHGRSVVVGAFLSPEERLDFARALAAALDELRRAPS